MGGDCTFVLPADKSFPLWLVKNGFVLVTPGFPLGSFQKTRATLPVAEFRQLLAADVSGVLALRKTTSHGNIRWQVSFQIAGRRRRRFFKTKAESRAWLSELRWQSPVEQFWQTLAPIVAVEHLCVPVAYLFSGNS